MVRKSSAIILTLLLIMQGFHTRGQAVHGQIHFVVSMEKPAHHLFHVVMQCRGLNMDSLDFSMPVWSPGYYRIMDYAQHILNFKVNDGQGKKLTWEKTDKNTWRVWAGRTDSLTVAYDVYACNISVAEPFLDEGRAFLSPTGLFLYIDGLIRHPVTMTLRLYEGFRAVSTGLDPVDGQTWSFYAPDFDVLYDCPVLAGNQEILDFTIRGIPHIIALEDTGNIDRQNLVRDLKKSVETVVSLFGDIPYRHYTFLMMTQGRGGLEHANSMAVYYDIRNLADENNYRDYLAFFTHEYFHLYNVKAIRPISLGPFDYDRENDTKLLWISEGLTVYYEYQILNRAGLMSREDCLGEFSRIIRNYENIPGHRFQSLDESGINVWMQFFNFLDPAKKNTTISYYDKGCVLGLMLDLAIRHETEGKKSLDDVMRMLYEDFYKKRNRGFTEQEFRSTCETVAGTSLDEIFVYASTVDPVDYPKYFGYAGLEIDTSWHELQGIHTGLKIQEGNNNLRISFVEWDSPAWKSGLSEGDLVTEIEGRPANASVWKEITESVNPGDTIMLHIIRRGMHIRKEIIAGRKYGREFPVTYMKNPSSSQRKVLAGWFCSEPPVPFKNNPGNQ